MKKGNLFLLLVVLSTTSCVKHEVFESGRQETRDPMEIQLQSAMVTAESTTRAVINGIPAEGLGVFIARQDATNESGTFPDYTALAAANVKASTIASGGEVSFTGGKEYYLANGYSTRMIGWYPAATLGSNDGVLTWTLDGNNDILLSNAITGNKTAPFSSSTKLAFAHKLTKLTVRAYAGDAEAAARWGTINAVKVPGRQTTCTVTLPATVAFSGSAELNISKKGDGTSVGNLTMGASAAAAAEFGTILLAPATASEQLTLKVTTSVGGESTVSIPKQAYLDGKAYLITLKFTSSEITPQATITAWEDGTNPGDIIM